MTTLLALCAWLLKTQLNKQEGFNLMIETRMRAVETQVTVNSIGRLSTGEWINAKQNLDAAIAALDKRVMRNEDNMSRVLKGIERIEDKLDKHLKP